jgi:hypothetical protein
MAKVFGLLLIVLGIYLGITVYEEGVDAAFGGVFGRSEAPVAEETAPDDEGRPPAEPRPGARPGAVTQRVRERVNAAVQEGVRRHTGESGVR